MLLKLLIQHHHQLMMKVILFKNLNMIQHQVKFSLLIININFYFIPVKQYDPSLFLEKIEQSLENVVNGVMQAGKTNL